MASTSSTAAFIKAAGFPPPRGRQALPVLPLLPQHVAASGPLVEHAGEDEQVIRQPVEVLERERIDRLGVGFRDRERDHAAFTLATKIAMWPRWIGCRNSSSSMETVTTCRRQKRCPEMAAQMSIQAATCPPKIVPMALVCSGRTIWVISTRVTEGATAVSRTTR